MDVSSPENAAAAPEDDWGILSELPGNPMMWLLIGSELAVFGAAFLSFAVARTLQPEVFLESQDTLNRLLGALNTLVLITSGFFAALAVRFQSEDKSAKARGMIGISALFGFSFLVIKIIEYADKYEAGIGIETNTFFTLYYLLTGFHFLHVILGLIILGVVAWKNSFENIETGAAFWHMVDLIWVVLFPLVYLMR